MRDEWGSEGSDSGLCSGRWLRMCNGWRLWLILGHSGNGGVWSFMGFFFFPSGGGFGGCLWVCGGGRMGLWVWTLCLSFPLWSKSFSSKSALTSAPSLAILAIRVKIDCPRVSVGDESIGWGEKFQMGRWEREFELWNLRERERERERVNCWWEKRGPVSLTRVEFVESSMC